MWTCISKGKIISHAKAISTGGIDRVCQFLPTFERKDYQFAHVEGGKYEDGTFTLPYYTYSHEVLEFESLLYKENFIYSFDWTKWQKQAEKLCIDPKALQSADLLTIRKLLTTHIRKERFCEGHLLSVLESGHISDVLRRLKELRQEMQG